MSSFSTAAAAARTLRTGARTALVRETTLLSSLVGQYQPPHQKSQGSSSGGATTTRSMTILSKQSAEEYKKLNFTERAKRTGRPVSPHVTIYSFPIGALTSIMNRVTGCVLSFGAAGLGAVELVGGSGTALDLMGTIGSQGGVVTAGAKFAVAFPFVYHYLGGVRHLSWDQMPDYLTNEDVDKASYALAGTSLLLSLGLVVV